MWAICAQMKIYNTEASAYQKEVPEQIQLGTHTIRGQRKEGDGPTTILARDDEHDHTVPTQKNRKRQ